MKPLQGITVVTLEHAIAAPFATRQLADLGARVIKIERPGMGDFARGEWTADWDALYWTFVRDHHDTFARNHRSRMVATLYDRMDPATKAAHTRRAAGWLA